MLEEGTGEFYNQTLYKANEKPVIPLKKDKPVEKYGGYSGENKAYFVIFEYENKKKNKEYQLIGIPIQVAYMIKTGKMTEEEYIRITFFKDKDFENLKILRNKILKNQEYIDENGVTMRFCSDTEIRTAKELIVNEKMQKLIYFMNMDEKNLKDEEKEELKNSFDYMYEYLLDKMKKEYPVFDSTYNKLIEKDFHNLEENNKKSVINGLIDLMETGQGDLRGIGLSDREGRKRSINFSTKRLQRDMSVDVEQETALVGRAGLRLGKRFAGERSSGEIYVRGDLLHQFTDGQFGHIRDLEDVESLHWGDAGTWTNFGVGGYYQFANKFSMQLDLEKSAGGEQLDAWMVSGHLVYNF